MKRRKVERIWRREDSRCSFLPCRFPSHEKAFPSSQWFSGLLEAWVAWKNLRVKGEPTLPWQNCQVVKWPLDSFCHSTYCNTVTSPRPVPFFWLLSTGNTQFWHPEKQCVCVLIKSRGQQPMAHRPNPDQIWPMTYFCVACDFKMAFTFLKVCERKKTECVTETTYCLPRPRYRLSSLYRDTLPSPD